MIKGIGQHCTREYAGNNAVQTLTKYKCCQYTTSTEKVTNKNVAYNFIKLQTKLKAKLIKFFISCEERR